MTKGAPNIRLVGRYALYGAIASGGMATVFLGRLLGPVGFSRTVAIKRLHPQFASDPEFVSMFLDEARLAARIRHPNVVPTLDVVATKGELFLVMEYVHGESLARLIRAAALQKIPIPVPIIAAIMSGVLQGLHAAHEAKSERGLPLEIVHRDISPQNILVGIDGQARVLDFGVARAAGRAQNTQQGQIKGKLAYMPPEQFHGEEVGPETDVYAASVVLWEALTSRRLFRGDNEGAIIAKILGGEIAPPSHGFERDPERHAAIEALDDVVMRGLARDKSQRWPTAREMSRALEARIVPATAAQVAEWVETAAESSLYERAAILAEIESNSAHDVNAGDVSRAMGGGPEGSRPGDPGAATTSDSKILTELTASDFIAAEGTSSEWSKPSAARSPPPTGDGIPPREMSSGSAVFAAPTPPKVHLSPVARKQRLGIAVGIGALLGGTCILFFGLRDDGPSDPKPELTTTRPAATVPAPPAPTSPPSATEPPPAIEFPSTIPSAREPDATAVTVPSSPPAKTSPPKGSGKSGTHPSNHCDPPFTYDAQGMKHYKDECF